MSGYVYEREQDRRAVEGIWASIKSYTDSSPTGCPWHAFSDPVVIDIIQAYTFWESGQLDTYWTSDPPSIVVDGIRHYHDTLMRIQAKQMELDRKNRENSR